MDLPETPTFSSLHAVSVVVTTHNAKATLPRTLASLSALRGVSEVTVIDSGSTDGTPDLVTSLLPNARLIKLVENVGPCATRNLGLTEARSPFVLWLDDDMVFDADMLDRLLSVLLGSPDHAAVGPTIVFDDRPDSIQYAGGRMHFGGLPHLFRLGEKPDAVTPPIDVDILTAGCLLIRRDAAMAIQGFDERFFYLAEDVDFALRLRYRGFRLMLVSSVVVRNVGGSSALSLKDAAYPARRVELHSRNRWLLVGRNYDAWTIFALAPALLLYEAAWAVFAVSTGHMVPYLRGKIRAVGSLLERSPWKRKAKRVTDRRLIGAPAMTFTRTALSQGGAKAGAAALDGSLRMMWTCLRGLVQ